MLPTKIRSTRVASAEWLRSAGRKRLGNDNTHCRIGTRGMSDFIADSSLGKMRPLADGSVLEAVLEQLGKV